MNNIDPDLQYCPQCKDEYREDFTTCALCKVELVSGIDLLDAISTHGKPPTTLAQIVDGDELVVLQKGSLLDMKNRKRLLEKAFIPALILKDADDSNQGCCGPELFLHIRQEDMKRAHDVLAHEHINATALPDYDLSTVDSVFDPGASTTLCPACGTEFMPTCTSCPDCGLQFG